MMLIIIQQSKKNHRKPLLYPRSCSFAQRRTLHDLNEINECMTSYSVQLKQTDLLTIGNKKIVE
ncbi:unnamed protein product, partial [Rotaria sp. Silwood1]